LTLLFRLVKSVFIIKYIVHKINNFMNGPEIISTIHSLYCFNKPIPLISKIKVYLYLLFYILFGAITFTLSLDDLNSIIENIINENLKLVFQTISGMFIAVTQTSVVIIMMFTSELVSQELNELVVRVNNYGKFGSICMY